MSGKWGRLKDRRIMDTARAIQRVVREISKSHDISIHNIVIGKSRKSPIVAARHEAIYAARKATGASYPILGWYFQLDHTSILHAVRKLEKQASLCESRG